MSSFVSSPASEFGLIFFIAGWFLDLEKDANLFIHRFLKHKEKKDYKNTLKII